MSHQIVDLTSNHTRWCPSNFLLFYFSPQGFQFGSVAQSSLTVCDPMDFEASQVSLFITNSWSLLKLMSIESVIPSNHLILLLPPSIFPSIRGFSSESILLSRWPKYWGFSFSISPSNEYLGLLDLLIVQGTLKNLLQYHSSKGSILRHSAFFIVQLSHPFLINGKTLALTRWTFVGLSLGLE